LKTKQELTHEFRAHRDSIKATLDKASAEGRDLTQQERDANADRFTKMDEIRLALKGDVPESETDYSDKKLGRHDAALPKGHPDYGKPAYQPATSDLAHNLERRKFTDQVRPLEKFESAVKYLGVRDVHGVGIGEYMRAMVLGPRTDRERFALAEGTDSAGGYVVNPFLSATIIDALRGDSIFSKAGAQIVPLTTNKTTLARVATDPVPTWRAENAAVAESDMAFEAVVLAPKTLAVIVRASRELLEDSVNINDAIGSTLSAAMSAEVDRAAGFGSGTGNQPLGVANTPGILTVTSAANGDQLTSYSKLLDALLALETNNVEPNAVVMSPREARKVNGFADTTNQPLQKPDALKDLLYITTPKVPVNQTQGTSNVASSIIMGDFRKLILGVRSEFRIEVLKERYADNLQYGFLAWLRMDVGVANPKAFAKISGIIP
jgi:HK97 family phage major capsid protein